MSSFTVIEKSLKISLKPQNTLSNQNNLEQNEQKRKHHSDFEIYYRTIIIKHQDIGIKIDIKTNGIKFKKHINTSTNI